MTTHIALLRGINVTGRNKVPMAELKEVAGALGWRDVESYIQSGNLVFAASGTRAKLEAALESGIRQRFDLAIPVLVRAARDWSGYVAANPFARECATQAKHVMLALSKSAPRAEAASELQARATAGERVARTGDVLWIYFPESVARSKLSPALLDRLAGSPVTMRNWNTVLKLEEMTRD